MKPNQQNHRMNTPKAAEVILWPRIARGVAVLVILANAGPQDLAPMQSAQAAHHVHRGGTGEIVEAQLRKPAAAPNPVAGNGVDD